MDLYQTVTDRIVAMIEEGAGTYKMPWHAGRSEGGELAMPRNVTGRAYRGINVPLLWVAADKGGYAVPVWATYQHWQERGAQVRKGDKATVIVFWKQLVFKKDAAEGDDATETRMMAKAYCVFNAAQCDGVDLTKGKQVPSPADLTEEQRNASAEAFFAATGSIVRHGGDRAYYSPGGDHIQMPAFAAFREPAGYYAVLAHEHTHWTGAEKRCNRQFGRRFGDEAYAFEELVAELGAAFVGAMLRISAEPRQDHAAYIASWLRVLKSDKRAIFTAASKAQAAADYLAGLQITTTPLAA
jgi:antirestriction protein ArdC